jgi:hypothetical protein
LPRASRHLPRHNTHTLTPDTYEHIHTSPGAWHHCSPHQVARHGWLPHQDPRARCPVRPPCAGPLRHEDRPHRCTHTYIHLFIHTHTYIQSMRSACCAPSLCIINNVHLCLHSSCVVSLLTPLSPASQLSACLSCTLPHCYLFALSIFSCYTISLSNSCTRTCDPSTGIFPLLETSCLLSFYLLPPLSPYSFLLDESALLLSTLFHSLVTHSPCPTLLSLSTFLLALDILLPLSCLSFLRLGYCFTGLSTLCCQILLSSLILGCALFPLTTPRLAMLLSPAHPLCWHVSSSPSPPLTIAF